MNKWDVNATLEESLTISFHAGLERRLSDWKHWLPPTGSIPSTHMMAQDSLRLQFRGYVTLAPSNRHTRKQNTNEDENKSLQQNKQTDKPFAAL